MEQLNHNKTLLKIKDKNIVITDILDKNTHFEIMAKLDYEAPKCPKCKGQTTKYDFQKTSKIPYLDIAGYKSLIRLKKRRFRCKNCHKMMVAETSLVKKNHQIPHIINHKINQRLTENRSMTDIANELAISTSTVYRQLQKFHFKTDFNQLPEVLAWDEFSFRKGKMSFVAQDHNTNKIIAILDGRNHTVIRNHFLRYPYSTRAKVKWLTMDMFAPYYALARKLFPNAKIVLDRFHIIQHLNRAMNKTRIRIMNSFDRKSHQYKAIKRYWKLIQKDSRTLSSKRFYRPMFRMHLTNQEIITKLLSHSNELAYYYELYQLLLFHFQEKNSNYFFDLIKQELEAVNPTFYTVFQTFLKDKEKIINALEQPYSNGRLEATNNLIKVIKRNAFGFRNFENFRTRILINLNIKKEKTNLILSRL